MKERLILCLKKAIAVTSSMVVMVSIFGLNAYAEQVNWNRYYTGPGAAYPTDIVTLTYNNPVTNYVKATSVSGTNAKVVVSGTNVYLYDIASGHYTTYTFTSSNLTQKSFRPVSKSGTISKGQYQCASSGSSTYYSAGYLAY